MMTEAAIAAVMVSQQRHDWRITPHPDLGATITLLYVMLIASVNLDQRLGSVRSRQIIPANFNVLGVNIVDLVKGL